MAGAIKTGPVTPEYEAGWERAFGADVAELHEDSDDIEAAVAGDTEATDEAPVERQSAPLAHLGVSYACDACGWHLKTSSERCGNSACPGRRRRG